MKNEDKLILELCKFKGANENLLNGLLEGCLDYPYVLGHLLYNRVGGVAYYTLKNHGLLRKVNREFRNALKVSYESNIEKKNNYAQAIDGLKVISNQLTVPYAMLKGAYLLDLYPEGLRSSNDIDFLIDSQNVSELGNVLKWAGFQQGYIRNEVFVPASRSEIVSSRMNRGETVPFIKEINLPRMKYLEVDINFSLGFRPGVDENVVSLFLANTKPLIHGQMATLDLVDFLIHLCAHLFKEATVFTWVEMGRDISLYKYCDIYMFIIEYLDQVFSEKLLNRVYQTGMLKETYYALYYTKILFDLKIDVLDRLLDEIRPRDEKFLDQIIDPQADKLYQFDMDYIEWVFCSNRKEKLYEVRNDEKQA